MTDLQKIQELIDLVEAKTPGWIGVVWMDGIEFRDPDKFMDYLIEKGYI